MIYKLMNLSVGMRDHFEYKGKEYASAISKKPIKEVFLALEGFRGDTVVDKKHHGGVDRAVCLYPFEHYHYWNEEFSTSLPSPAFGENMCTTGMMEKDVYIGDIFKFGETIIQVTQGRIPCSTISKFNGIDALLPRIVETCFTGYFFRVLQEGTVSDSSEIKLLDRTQENVTVYYANQVMFHDRRNKKALEEMLAIKELAKDWKDRFSKALASIK
jgi:MOSC domain-containing protein YiiM